MENLQKIKNNEVYKQILKDSFGGIMYTEGTQSNYNSKEILNLWNGAPESQKEASGGIMKGVFNFLNS